MKLLFFILMVIMMQACLPIRDEMIRDEMISSEAEMKIYHEWLYAFRLSELKAGPGPITRPPGVEQLILKVLLPSDSGLNFKTHCVYYQVPYKKIIGVMKIVEQKNDTPCAEVSSQNAWLTLKNIADLTVTQEPYKLIFKFTYQNQKVNWSFVLPNVENGIIHQKFQAAKERKLFPGLTLLKYSDLGASSIQNTYLGKLSDRLSRGSAIRCHQVDKNCQDIGENRCEQCAFGWYQVVDYNCPQGGSKFCGQNHCGQKNEPACLRGTKVVNDLDAGICESDLSPVLSAEHVLICQ